MFQLSIEKDYNTDLSLTSLAVWSKGDNLLGGGNIFETNRRGKKHLKPTANSLLRRLEMIWVTSVVWCVWYVSLPVQTARKTREEVEEIHKQAHSLLVRHYSTIRQFRKKQYQWENLLARLDTDSELLLRECRLLSKLNCSLFF